MKDVNTATNLRLSTLAGCLLFALASPLALARGKVTAAAPQQNGQTSTNNQSKPGKSKPEHVTKLSDITVTTNTVAVRAPSAQPMSAIQPTSVMGTRFIRDSLRLDASYTSILRFAPSVSVAAPEGPGLGKMEATSIRGFQDGQFNVTFDGIPFGNQANLHRSTSAYFTNHVLRQAEVDRGPGGGATIGNATFGGTVALRTREPATTSGVTPYLTFGSWGDRGQGISANLRTGKTGVFANVSHSRAETYLKGTDDRAKHAFIKLVSHVSPNVTLTAVTSYNQEHQNTVQGATEDEIARFGWRFGLGNDPTTQNYKKYNAAGYYSSFNYFGVDAALGNWEIDNKVYVITFTHHSYKATDASDIDPSHNGVTLYDAAGNKVGKLADHVPGKISNSHYHSFGDVFRTYRYFGSNILKTGVWVERDIGGEWSKPWDMTANGPSGYKYASVFEYYYDETDTTFQPYAEFDVALNSWLKLTPGIKYTQTIRALSSRFGKEAPFKGKHVFTKGKYKATLPSIALHARFTNNMTGYIQAAKGFLAPPVNVVEANPAPLKPEQTTNYQIGTAYATKRLAFGVDAYYIDFSNLLQETLLNTDQGILPSYVNSGGAHYKGEEFELTYELLPELSLYVNGSHNKAIFKHSGGVSVAQSPNKTAALGLLYGGNSGLYGSLMSKYTGPQYGLDNGTDASGNTVYENSQRLGGYTVVNFSVGYRATEGGFRGKGWTVALHISNLFNVHKKIVFAGTQKVSGKPLFFGLAGRGAFLDLSMNF